MVIFLDTYALVEIFEGNEKYLNYKSMNYKYAESIGAKFVTRDYFFKDFTNVEFIN